MDGMPFRYAINLQQRDVITDPLRHLDSLIKTRVRQQHQKLLATVASYPIERAQLPFGAAGDRHQHAVANMMAQLVIDLWK